MSNTRENAFIQQAHTSYNSLQNALKPVCHYYGLIANYNNPKEDRLLEIVGMSMKTGKNGELDADASAAEFENQLKLYIISQAVVGILSLSVTIPVTIIKLLAAILETAIRMVIVAPIVEAGRMLDSESSTPSLSR